MTNEKEFDEKRSGEISDAAMEQAAGGGSSGHMEGNKFIVATADPACPYFVCATCKKPLAPYFVPSGDADRYCQCHRSYNHCMECNYFGEPHNGSSVFHYCNKLSLQ